MKYVEMHGTKYENIRSLNQELTFSYAKEEFKNSKQSDILHYR